MKECFDQEFVKCFNEWCRNQTLTKAEREFYKSLLYSFFKMGFDLSVKNACERFKKFMRVQYGEDIDESMEMYFRETIGY